MLKLKQMLPYLVVTVIVFYLLPSLGKSTGNFMLILLIAIPLICFTTALLYGATKGFDLSYPLIVAILFTPTIFIYYNSSAWIYIVIYAVITLVGNIFGSLITHQIK